MNLCNRNDERYLEDEPGMVSSQDVKKSRFLKKERKVELSYKDQKEPEAPEVPRRRRKEVSNLTRFRPLSHDDLLQAKPLPELKEPVAEEKNNAEVEKSKQ